MCTINGLDLFPKGWGGKRQPVINICVLPHKSLSFTWVVHNSIGPNLNKTPTPLEHDPALFQNELPLLKVIA